MPSSSLADASHPPAQSPPQSAGYLVHNGIRFRIPQAKTSAPQTPQAPTGHRGSIAAAAATAASEESMATAITKLLRDQFATTSMAARNSQLRTWLSMHRMAFCRSDDPPPPFPLTEDIIVRVAALFKAAGYRSFDNYIGRAKAEHIALGTDAGGEWSHSLDRASKDAMRSVARGIGKARQSTPIDIVAISRLALPSEPLIPGGPISPAEFAMAGTLFMLREIELAAARTNHITIHDSHASASWLLPSSKTDCRAVGVTRTLDCMCGVVELRGICPVSILQLQLNRVASLAACLGCDASSLPLFPDARGLEVSRANAVATIVGLSQRSGFRTTAPNGSQLYGGHSLRTGGATLYASMGVHPLRIQALGRWRSPLVLHYAGEAMASNVVKDLKRGNFNPLSTGPAAPSDTAVIIERLCSRLSALEQNMAATEPSTCEDEAVVVNVATQCLHKIVVSDTTHASRTICGWQFADEQIALLTDDPSLYQECDICFRIHISDSDS